MTNCKNCGAPIDIYTGRCPYCETPYEASGGSETGEKLGREKIHDRNSCTLEISRFDSAFGEIKTLQTVEDIIGSSYIDDDFVERAAKYACGESLTPKWD